MKELKRLSRKGYVSSLKPGQDFEIWVRGTHIPGKEDCDKQRDRSKSMKSICKILEAVYVLAQRRAQGSLAIEYRANDYSTEMEWLNHRKSRVLHEALLSSAWLIGNSPSMAKPRQELRQESGGRSWSRGHGKLLLTAWSHGPLTQMWHHLEWVGPFYISH